MKAKQFPFERVAAISGSGQQHGSAYWKTGALKTLQSLKAGVPLKTQLASAFRIPESPIWMDSSTSAQCQSLGESACICLDDVHYILCSACVAVPAGCERCLTRPCLLDTRVATQTCAVAIFFASLAAALLLLCCRRVIPGRRQGRCGAHRQPRVRALHGEPNRENRRRRPRRVS